MAVPEDEYRWCADCGIKFKDRVLREVFPRCSLTDHDSEPEADYWEALLDDAEDFDEWEPDEQNETLDELLYGEHGGEG